MREISLDTETTGLEAENGDRIVEIGCVELINHVPTSSNFHVYIDPQRAMHPDATRITGITDDMLRGKPLFAQVAQGFIDFIGDDPLVIHNASFDMRFINAEFARINVGPLNPARVVDTLAIARKRFPGAQASLDALCRRFGIDNSNRELHGALLDAELLAEVYLELRGGRQPDLGFASSGRSASTQDAGAGAKRELRPARPSARLTVEERAAHQAFVETLGEEAMWLRAEILRGESAGDADGS